MNAAALVSACSSSARLSYSTFVTGVRLGEECGAPATAAGIFTRSALDLRERLDGDIDGLFPGQVLSVPAPDWLTANDRVPRSPGVKGNRKVHHFREPKSAPLG